MSYLLIWLVVRSIGTDLARLRSFGGKSAVLVTGTASSGISSSLKVTWWCLDPLEMAVPFLSLRISYEPEPRLAPTSILNSFFSGFCWACSFDSGDASSELTLALLFFSYIPGEDCMASLSSLALLCLSIGSFGIFSVVSGSLTSTTLSVGGMN